jgi:hypothetical protein
MNLQPPPSNTSEGCVFWEWERPQLSKERFYLSGDLLPPRLIQFRLHRLQVVPGTEIVKRKR